MAFSNARAEALRVELCDGTPPPAARALRRRVFVGEQGVAPEEEFDALDASSLHILLFCGDTLFGCARLRPYDAPRCAKVERVAVPRARRRHGYGRRVMDAVETAARARGFQSLLLHAQLRALEFYERLGWQSFGAEFTEAGIPHRKMQKIIKC